MDGLCDGCGNWPRATTWEHDIHLCATCSAHAEQIIAQGGSVYEVLPDLDGGMDGPDGY